MQYYEFYKKKMRNILDIINIFCIYFDKYMILAIQNGDVIRISLLRQYEVKEKHLFWQDEQDVNECYKKVFILYI